MRGLFVFRPTEELCSLPSQGAAAGCFVGLPSAFQAQYLLQLWLFRGIFVLVELCLYSYVYEGGPWTTSRVPVFPIASELPMIAVSRATLARKQDTSLVGL